MKYKFEKFAIITLVFLIIISPLFVSSYQYYCYSCSNCNDPFITSAATLVFCTNGCYKNVVRGSPWSVSRGCSTNSNGCTNKIWGAMGFGEYNYCCWNNYCNGSDQLLNQSFPHKLIFLAAVIGVLLLRVLG